MAVTCTIRPEGRGGGYDEKGNVTQARQWLCVTDDPTDDVLQVLLALPVALYDPHPKNPLATARSVQVAPFNGPNQWLATVSYSDGPLAAQAGVPTVQDPNNPSKPTPTNETPAPDRTPTFTFQRNEVVEAAEQDAQGNPYVNTVGDKLEGMERVRSNLLVTIKYWSISVTIPHLVMVWDKVNHATYRGFPAETVLLRDFGYEPVYDLIAPGVFGGCAHCTVQLEWNPKTWVRKVLNAGYREKKYIDGTPRIVAITDDAGQPVSTPYPLNADGTKWTGGAYHYLEFDDYELFDFEGLLV